MNIEMPNHSSEIVPNGTTVAVPQWATLISVLLYECGDEEGIKNNNGNTLTGVLIGNGNDVNHDGYHCGCSFSGSVPNDPNHKGTGGISSKSAFVMNYGGYAYPFSGSLTLLRNPANNTWVASGSGVIADVMNNPDKFQGTFNCSGWINLPESNDGYSVKVDTIGNSSNKVGNFSVIWA